jgi:hypothetical protein
MDDAEVIVDRWSEECRNETLKAREKVTTGDALNVRDRSRCGKR